MNIPVLLLANNAQVSNSLLEISGGGWENFSCPSFPWQVAGVLAGVVELDDVERNEPQVLEFNVRDHAGQELGVRASMVIRSTRGDGPGRSPFTIPFTFAVTEPSLAVFAIESKGSEVASLSIPIRGLPSNLE